MRFRDLAFLTGLAGAATLIYGALVESNRLVLERHSLTLSDWPERLNGFRIAVLGDLHIRDKYSVALAKKAVAMALNASPDMVVLVGDLVSYWKPEMPRMLGEVLEPLLLMEGNVVGVPGNHDYSCGPVENLAAILSELNIKLLRNESWRHQGITWVGVDSQNAGQARPVQAMAEVLEKPRIALWHEPDCVDDLPQGCVLQISGHSHGGQFRLPFGVTPMYSENGKRYPQGFYPLASTPLYVTRGVGTTGPPSRFLCPPEVSLLTLFAADPQEA